MTEDFIIGEEHYAIRDFYRRNYGSRGSSQDDDGALLRSPLVEHMGFLPSWPEKVGNYLGNPILRSQGRE